jgi:hypothetical protein
VAAVTVRGAFPEFVRVKTLSELAAKAAGDKTADSTKAARRDFNRNIAGNQRNIIRYDI